MYCRTEIKQTYNFISKLSQKKTEIAIQLEIMYFLNAKKIMLGGRLHTEFVRN